MAYFFYVSQPSPIQEVSSPQEINVTINNETELVGWKKYVNETYNYEIMYPTDFSIRVTNEIGQDIRHQTKKSNGVEINVIQDEFKDLKSQNLPDLKTFYKYVDKFVTMLATAGYEDATRLYSKKAVKFNGYDAVEIKYNPAVKTDNEPVTESLIIIYHSKQAFLISPIAFTGYEKPISQILATFKFTK